MPTYEWVCNGCHIYWDRELPMATAPKRTKCPKCKKLSNRYWQNQGVNLKWGDDTDFHAVRSRKEKVAQHGYDKTAGDRFLRRAIVKSKEAQDDESYRYKSTQIDWDKFAEHRDLRKKSTTEVEGTIKSAEKLTTDAYDRANKMGYKDIGSTSLDPTKPNKNGI